MVEGFKITSQIFIYLFISGCAGSSLLCIGFLCGEWGLLFLAVRGLLIAVASLLGEHGLQGTQASVVAALGFSGYGTQA